MTNSRSADPAPTLSRLTLWGTAHIALAHAGRSYDERLARLGELRERAAVAVATGDIEGAAEMEAEASGHHQALVVVLDRFEHALARAIAAEEAHRARQGKIAAPLPPSPAGARIKGRVW